MKTIFSGVTRRERLSALLQVGAKSIFVDFSFAKSLSKEELDQLRDKVEFLGLEFDLTYKWSRIKSLWSGSPSVKLVEKHGGVEEAQLHLLSKIHADVVSYCEWAEEYQDNFDVVVVPWLPIEHQHKWEKLLKSICSKLLVTIRSIDQLETLIPLYKYIGFDLTLLKEPPHSEIRRLNTLLRSFSCLTHVWGNVNKETVLEGAFWSASTSNWLSGSRYGNTYEYVGNLKIVQHHASKGKGKDSARAALKLKCDKLELDYDLLMKEDRNTVDMWSASQFVLFAKDSEKVNGYWSDKERKELVKVKTELVSSNEIVGYSRTCNSCYLSTQCPLFIENSNCRIPTTKPVTSPDDVQDLLNKIIQIQGDRVIFSAFAEKVQNVGINPEVSKELETLTKLMKDAKEIVAPVGSDELTIRAKGSGVINRLFGGYGKSGGSTKPSMSERIIDVSPIGDDDEE